MRKLLMRKLLLAGGLLSLMAGALAGCNTANDAGTATNTAAAPGAPDATSAGGTSDGSTEKSRGFVRAVHVVPGIQSLAVDVEAPVDSDKTETTPVSVTGLDYSNASSFSAVKPGKLKIYAKSRDDKNLSGPMPVTLESGEDMTVVVNGVPGDVAMLPFKHKNGGPAAGKGKVAFLHAAKALPKVDVIIDGRRYRGGVGYGVATDYTTLAPGRHTMQIVYEKSLPGVVVPPPTVITVPATPGAADAPSQDAPSQDASSPTIPSQTTPPVARPQVVKPKERVTLTQQLDLAAGKVYSVIVFHDAARLPKLLLLEDKFASELSRAPAADAPAADAPAAGGAVDAR